MSSGSRKGSWRTQSSSSVTARPSPRVSSSTVLCATRTIVPMSSGLTGGSASADWYPDSSAWGEKEEEKEEEENEEEEEKEKEEKEKEKEKEEKED